MSGRVEGKVAFITGAARGQGRSHAVRLAEEGADIIAVDIAAEIPNNMAPGATEAELAETVRQVEALGRRIVARKADVRDYDALKAAVDAGVAELGRLDIVVANAGITGLTHLGEDFPEQEWRAMIDINLSGAWHSAKAAIPHIKSGGAGGVILIISSAAGLRGFPRAAHYSAAKHGLVGLMRTLALELAGDFIRVNTIHPTQVSTEMILNDEMYKLFRPDLDKPTIDDFRPASQSLNAMPIPWVEPVDISNAVLFLASDEARYITGVALPVDAGAVIK
jgi:SDR family mycofactocin-dependent oxidoreductase